MATAITLSWGPTDRKVFKEQLAQSALRGRKDSRAQPERLVRRVRQEASAPQD